MPEIKLKVLYRRNLKMSPGKLAAQVAHAAIGMATDDDFLRFHPETSVVVLSASDAKFNAQKEKLLAGDSSLYCIVQDAGLTENEPGTETCLAFYSE